MIVAIDAVDPVVAGHDGHGLSSLHRDLEALEIELPQCPLAETGVVSIAVGLLVVAGKVLGTGAAATGLDPPHHRCRHDPRDQWILGEIFKIPPAEGISMEVHPRRQEHIHPQRLHLLCHQGVECLHGRGVKGTPLRRAAGQQRRRAVEADSGRAIAGNNRRQSTAAQRRRDAAEGAGVAAGAFRGVHLPLPPHQLVELLQGELPHQLRRRVRSGQDVGKGDRPRRSRQRCRQMRQNLPAKRPAAGGYRLPLAGAIPVDHPGKAVLFGQGTNLFALAHHLQLRPLPGEDFHRVPDVLPHLHGVAPRLQHVAISVPGGAGVVKGREVGKGYRQIKALPLPRRQELALLEGAEDLPGISQLALG